MRACVRACVPEKLKPPRTSRAWAVLGVVRATCCSPHHCTLPPTTTTTTTTPAVRGVCRNELKQTLVNKKKKRNTHTISHVSTPLPKQKANDRVLQPLPFTTIRRYYLCHDRVGEGGGVRRVRPIIRRIRFGMVREHFFTDVASARWRSVGVPGRGGGAMAGSSSSSTAGYTSQQIS